MGWSFNQRDESHRSRQNELTKEKMAVEGENSLSANSLSEDVIITSNIVSDKVLH